MNLLRYFIITCALISFAVLTSCNDYEMSEFKTIKLESSTIPFESSEDGFLLKSRVSSEATSILLVPSPESAKMALVTSVTINGQSQSTPGALTGDGPFLDEYPTLSGEWGAIIYPDDGPSIKIQLTANNTSDDRIIEIQLGYGYEYVRIHLIQSPHR